MAVGLSCPVSRAAAQHAGAPAARVAHAASPLDADERSGIAQPAQFTRDRVGDQVPVREDLEVAIRVAREDREQIRMHERLAAQNAEEAVPLALGRADEAVQRLLYEAMDRAAALLRQHRDKLDALAEVLVRDETVDRDGIFEILGEAAVPAEASTSAVADMSMSDK
jgi:hypothetical protein